MNKINNKRKIIVLVGIIARCFIYHGYGVQKFHPGHWVLHPTKNSTNVIYKIKNLDYITGVLIPVDWKILEPAENQYNFSFISNAGQVCKSMGKRLMIRLNERDFNTTIPASQPQYIIDNDGVLIVNEADNARVIPRLWTPYVMSRFIKLITKLGTAFDADSNFEGIIFPETSLGFKDPPHGFNTRIMIDKWKELFSASRMAFPNSVIMQNANYLYMGDINSTLADYYFEELFAYMYQNKIGGICGPDVFTYDTAATKFYAEYSKKTPLGIENQNKSYLAEGKDLNWLYNRVFLDTNGYRANYFFWSMHENWDENGDGIPDQSFTVAGSISANFLVTNVIVKNSGTVFPNSALPETYDNVCILKSPVMPRVKSADLISFNIHEKINTPGTLRVGYYTNNKFWKADYTNPYEQFFVDCENLPYIFSAKQVFTDESFIWASGITIDIAPAIIQPAQYRIYYAGSDIVITARKGSSISGVEKMGFYRNSLWVVSDYTEYSGEYSVNLENVLPGEYTFYVKQVNLDGSETFSDPVYCIVPDKPVITNHTMPIYDLVTFQKGENISIQIMEINPPEGQTVHRMGVHINGVWINSDYSAPWEYSIPSSCLAPGKNIIEIRQVNRYTGTTTDASAIWSDENVIIITD
ncbi:MAG: hypothetical protein A2096_01170 [Spirochaetes bacterium GWF1_41_5]|nr:MAG: hypothetical protein A2096_01170 [Spirochaetes bacterium GWF1_41_5]HBE02982.1 hypothetical protein [Spirochaetia bacterium]